MKLAPAAAVQVSNFGQFDFISGGAICNSGLFVISRIPNVAGRCRVFDDDVCDIRIESNMRDMAMME